MACSLCADGVRRYSARINAFILLPLYYSGATQGSQGGNKERFRMPAANGLRHPASASCLGRHSRLAGRCPNNSSLFPPLAAVVVVAGHLQRNDYFKFRVCCALRSATNAFFTEGAVKANGIARFHRSALSREKVPRSVCGRSGGPKSSIFFPLKLRRAKRSAIKTVVLYPGYRLTSSSSSARFTCSAVGGTASGRG